MTDLLEAIDTEIAILKANAADNYVRTHTVELLQKVKAQLCSGPELKLVQAASDLVKMRKDIMADVTNAHRSRDADAAEWMRDDDRKFHTNLRNAFDRLYLAVADNSA